MRTHDMLSLNLYLSGQSHREEAGKSVGTKMGRAQVQKGLLHKPPATRQVGLPPSLHFLSTQLLSQFFPQSASDSRREDDFTIILGHKRVSLTCLGEMKSDCPRSETLEEDSQPSVDQPLQLECDDMRVSQNMQHKETEMDPDPCGVALRTQVLSISRLVGAEEWGLQTPLHGRALVSVSFYIQACSAS